MIRIILFLFCIQLSYCSWSALWNSSDTNKIGKEAEKKFVEEMHLKSQAVRDLTEQVKEHSIWNFASLKTLFHFWNFFTKFRLLYSILRCSFQHDHFASKLKDAKRSLQTERFMFEKRKSSDIICETIFKHSFFKTNGWNHVETADNNSSYTKIAVAVSQEHFLRPVKICYASAHSKKFPVYVSAAENFDWKNNFVYFVFIQDTKNRNKVIAYLVNKN